MPLYQALRLHYVACKYATLVTLSLSVCSIHSLESMAPAQEERPFFPHALRLAREWRDFSELERCVQDGASLNFNCLYTGTFPIASIVVCRFDSKLLVKALMTGAKVDFSDRDNRSLFHVIAGAYRIYFKQEELCFPKKNLLSALALPTHYDTPLSPALDAQVRVKTALLCFNRLNCGLKTAPIKYCILSHLEDDIFSSKLLALTLSQRNRPEHCIGKYPLSWIQSVCNTKTGVDRANMIKRYARALAPFDSIEHFQPLQKKTTISVRHIKLQKVMLE